MKLLIRVQILLMVCVLTSTGSATPDFVAEPSGEVHVVEIIGLKFVPDNVDAQPGDTITWVNLDFVPHTATSKDGGWDTGTLAQNESKSLLVAEGMTAAYFCQFHPNMTAKITTDNR